MATKGERNRRLLEQAVQASPGDAYLHYQLGKDHEVHERLEAALDAYEHASQLLGPQPGRGPAWRHDLVLRSLFVLKATGRLAQAVQRAEAEMPLWPDSADFYFVLGDVLLDFAAAHPETSAGSAAHDSRRLGKLPADWRQPGPGGHGAWPRQPSGPRPIWRCLADLLPGSSGSGQGLIAFA